MIGTGLTVRAVEQLTSRRGAHGICDGMSFSEHNTVLYSPTDSRRENFTLLHEYGHLLVMQDEEAVNWIADQDEPAIELEKLCDEIAAMLLVPDEVLDAIVGKGPVTGKQLLDLFLTTEASQVVCAIALARRLTCTGAIVITDRTTQKVVYARLVDRPAVYPSSGQGVPSDHPLARLQPGQQLVRKSFWSTPWGTRNTYYLNAAASPKRTYAVLAELDLWNVDNLHVTGPEHERIDRARTTFACSCGFSGGTTGFPCPACGKQFCPRCGRCDCQRRQSLTEACKTCFAQSPKNDLQNGVCSDCH
ncbi:ImmA/IrrE family metallo-endopeptidase [Amycolatopsis sp. H20-H5]|uniref:ImmA/IrrE family metallo-endopeptidase n=1 Tax=Amycolatopsis sp. H20-H5 TaxID=3046309 RepID=UPI002DBD9BA7|nr:ImmA/IrrE family metallo-endopeptidase [Amycolatopsis sp. H20-H5]MEC3975786.1 ImmA/IrrE family metallo-endopeptidase [Amycolatopsis sp. H20-H5]